MKQIKFRGKDKYTGKYIYGNLYKYSPEKTLIRDDDKMPAHYVDYDSVAQLVGYDLDDKEIYSDDRVFDLNGNERLVADILVNFNSIGEHFDNVILKEN